MGQREDCREWLSPAERKWRYQREWSDGANMHPVYEMTDKVPEAPSSAGR